MTRVSANEVLWSGVIYIYICSFLIYCYIVDQGSYLENKGQSPKKALQKGCFQGKRDTLF